MSKLNELERLEEQQALAEISGTPKHIEINERTLIAYREEFAKKGLEIEQHKDYPMGETGFKQVKKLKKFDSIVDASQGIRKKIIAMTRQPVTIVDKEGKEVTKEVTKDALYYYGEYYGQDKKGNDISAHFVEGWYLRPKLRFIASDTGITKEDYNEAGERRGRYYVQGQTYEHYIFLSENKAERVKFLNDIIKNSPGTTPENLAWGAHLSYRQAHEENNHTGSHGGNFNWSQFCELSLRELGEVQSKGYYKEEKTGQLKDGSGYRVKFDDNTGKMEAIK